MRAPVDHSGASDHLLAEIPLGEGCEAGDPTCATCYDTNDTEINGAACRCVAHWDTKPATNNGGLMCSGGCLPSTDLT